MKRTLVFLGLSLTIPLIVACSQQEPARRVKVPAESSARETDAPHGTTPPAGAADAAPTSGTVVETMNAAGYTYVQVDTGTEKIWAAAPEFPVKVGDRVAIPEGAPMPNFHSNSLNRDFPVIYFVSSITNSTSGAAARRRKARRSSADRRRQASR